MKPYFLIILVFIYQNSFSQAENGTIESKFDSLKRLPKPKLGLPFGTIVKLKVSIFDGEKLNLKETRGVLLFRILAINDKELKDTLLMNFKDETNSISTTYNRFNKLTNPKKSKNKENSILDKQFIIMAYESGQFSGIPKGYYDYQPIKADVNFCFKNYLIVVANLKEEILVNNL